MHTSFPTVWGCPVNMNLESDRKRLSSWFPCVSLWLWISQLSALRFRFLFSTVGTKVSCAVVVKWGNSAGFPMGDTTLSSPFFNPDVSWLLSLSPWMPMWEKQSDSQPLVSVLKGYLSKSSYQSFKLLLPALTSASGYPDTWEWTEALGCCLPTLCRCFLLLH